MAGVAEDVELPIRVHDLLLGMAGRVDDDALSAARDLLAVGELTSAVEMLVGCLIAGRVVTNPREQDLLAEMLRQTHTDPGLVGNLKVRDSWLAQEHRFSAEDGPERGVGAALRPVLESLPGIEAISCVWRVTPAGAAPSALPQRVVLVELSRDGLPTATSYRVRQALAAAGLPAVVEVLRPGTPRGDYHSRALGEAGGIDGSSSNGMRHEPPPAAAGPVRPGAGPGRRGAGRTATAQNEPPQAEPHHGGFDGNDFTRTAFEQQERPPADDRPMGRPKPVAKRASVTRIQSPRTSDGQGRGSVGGAPVAGSDAGEDAGDSGGGSALAGPTATSVAQPVTATPATAHSGPESHGVRPATPTSTVDSHANPQPAAPQQHQRSGDSPRREQPGHLLAEENPRDAAVSSAAQRERDEPASAHFANPDLAGIGPVPAEPPAAPSPQPTHTGPQPVTHTGSHPVQRADSVNGVDQPSQRRLREVPPSVAKNLNDKERDLLRQLHEELAQREQSERQDSKKWQVARPTSGADNRPDNPTAAAGNAAWPPLATEETIVNGFPPIPSHPGDS